MSTYPHRINAITKLLEPCRLLADIGCDHAYVCIQAVLLEKAEKALACDINEGPLKKAEENIRESGVSDKVSTCLSDGLLSVPDDPDALTVCGMGGLLIKDILKASPEKLRNVKQLVLGPHSEIPELRKFITEESDFRIASETVVKDQGKYYVLLDLRKKDPHAPKSLSKEEYLTGKRSLQTDLSMYKEYLSSLIKKTQMTISRIDSSSENGMKRIRELEEELSILGNTYETV